MSCAFLVLFLPINRSLPLPNVTYSVPLILNGYYFISGYMIKMGSHQDREWPSKMMWMAQLNRTVSFLAFHFLGRLLKV